MLDPEDEEYYEAENSIPFEDDSEGAKADGEESEGEEGRNLQTIASSLDWRAKGAVTAVKN